MKRKLTMFGRCAAASVLVLLLALWGFSYWRHLLLQWQSCYYVGKTRVQYWTHLDFKRGAANISVYTVRETVGIVAPDKFTDFRCYTGPANSPGGAPHFIGNLVGVDASVWSWRKPLQSIYNVDFWIPGWLLLFPIGAIVWNARRALIRRRRSRLGQCVSCGYDLRASAGRCPECGLRITGAREGGIPRAGAGTHAS